MPTTDTLQAHIKRLLAQFPGDLMAVISGIHDDPAVPVVDDGKNYGVQSQEHPEFTRKDYEGWEALW